MGNDCSQAVTKLPLPCSDYVDMARCFIHSQVKALMALKIYPKHPAAVAGLLDSYDNILMVLDNQNWDIIDVLLTSMQEDIDIISVYDEQDVISRVLCASIKRGYNSFRQNFMDIFKKTCKAKREEEFLHPECSYCRHDANFFARPIEKPEYPTFGPETSSEEKARTMQQYRKDCRTYREKVRAKQEWDEKMTMKSGQIPVINRDEHPMASTSVEDFYMTRAEDLARKTLEEANTKPKILFDTKLVQGPTSAPDVIESESSDDDYERELQEQNYDPRDYDIRVDSAGNVSY